MNYKYMLLQDLFFIIKLTLKKHTIVYFLIFANIFSIFLEFSAIGVLGLISKVEIKEGWELLQGFSDTTFFITFLALSFFRLLTLLILESLSMHYAKELQVYFSTKALIKITLESIKEIEKESIGHYSTLAGDEASNASQVFVSMMNILNAVILVLVYIVLVIIFSSEILLWLFFFLIGLALIIKPIFRRIFTLGYNQAILRRESDSFFLDILNSLRIIKTFSLTSFMPEQYHYSFNKYCNINRDLIIYKAILTATPLLLLFSFYGLYLIAINTDYEVTFLIALFFILLRLLHSIGILANALGKVIGELKGIGNIVSFIKHMPINNKSIVIKEQITNIEVNNISFSYENNNIFDNFSANFKIGTSYAIAGESGSGKSTLLDIIMDYISPKSGEVLLNHKNIKYINEETITQKVIYIGQENLILNKSIRDNIKLDRNFSDKDIQIVLKMVKLDQVVEDFNDGLSYMLNYHGTNISGGQRQRINLARALIRKPDVLILDEITNALDTTTRDFILDNIFEEYKDKILIFVTHDKSICMRVNKIINLKHTK